MTDVNTTGSRYNLDHTGHRMRDSPLQQRLNDGLLLVLCI